MKEGGGPRTVCADRVLLFFLNRWPFCLSCVRCAGTVGQHAAQAPILSWQEAGKPEEERGKVGEGWPWEESEDTKDKT
jgi:hypothetical protein